MKQHNVYQGHLLVAGVAALVASGVVALAGLTLAQDNTTTATPVGDASTSTAVSTTPTTGDAATTTAVQPATGTAGQGDQSYGTVQQDPCSQAHSYQGDRCTKEQILLKYGCVPDISPECKGDSAGGNQPGGQQYPSPEQQGPTPEQISQALRQMGGRGACFFGTKWDGRSSDSCASQGGQWHKPQSGGMQGPDMGGRGGPGPQGDWQNQQGQQQGPTLEQINQALRDNKSGVCFIGDRWFGNSSPQKCANDFGQWHGEYTQPSDQYHGAPDMGQGGGRQGQNMGRGMMGGPGGMTGGPRGMGGMMGPGRGGQMGPGGFPGMGGPMMGPGGPGRGGPSCDMFDDMIEEMRSRLTEMDEEAADRLADMEENMREKAADQIERLQDKIDATDDPKKIAKYEKQIAKIEGKIEKQITKMKARMQKQMTKMKARMEKEIAKLEDKAAECEDNEDEGGDDFGGGFDGGFNGGPGFGPGGPGGGFDGGGFNGGPGYGPPVQFGF